MLLSLVSLPPFLTSFFFLDLILIDLCFRQVVPLECILQFKASTKHHNGTGLSPLDNQHLVLSVYSSCRVTINSLHNGKICTGFGPGSLRDKLTKKRQVSYFKYSTTLKPLYDIIRQHLFGHLENIVTVE